MSFLSSFSDYQRRKTLLTRSIEAVAQHHKVKPADYIGQRISLGHPDSSAVLIRRATRREKASQNYGQAIDTLEKRLRLKTENQG